MALLVARFCSAPVPLPCLLAVALHRQECLDTTAFPRARNNSWLSLLFSRDCSAAAATTFTCARFGLGLGVGLGLGAGVAGLLELLEMLGLGIRLRCSSDTWLHPPLRPPHTVTPLKLLLHSCT